MPNINKRINIVTSICRYAIFFLFSWYNASDNARLLMIMMMMIELTMRVTGCCSNSNKYTDEKELGKMNAGQSSGKWTRESLAANLTSVFFTLRMGNLAAGFPCQHSRINFPIPANVWKKINTFIPIIHIINNSNSIFST